MQKDNNNATIEKVLPNISHSLSENSDKIMSPWNLGIIHFFGLDILMMATLADQLGFGFLFWESAGNFPSLEMF
jgi:hypothetical protein